MHENVYPVTVSIKHDRLNGLGYVASVQSGHRSVRNLFAFGDNRKDAGTALAKIVYETLARSRFDHSGIESIALIEVHLVPLEALGAPHGNQH